MLGMSLFLAILACYEITYENYTCFDFESGISTRKQKVYGVLIQEKEIHTDFKEFLEARRLLGGGNSICQIHWQAGVIRRSRSFSPVSSAYSHALSNARFLSGNAEGDDQEFRAELEQNFWESWTALREFAH